MTNLYYLCIFGGSTFGKCTKFSTKVTFTVVQSLSETRVCECRREGHDGKYLMNDYKYSDRNNIPPYTRILFIHDDLLHSCPNRTESKRWKLKNLNVLFFEFRFFCSCAVVTSIVPSTLNRTRAERCS